jgi:hypothetical protein
VVVGSIGMVLGVPRWAVTIGTIAIVSMATARATTAGVTEAGVTEALLLACTVGSASRIEATEKAEARLQQAASGAVRGRDG